MVQSSTLILNNGVQMPQLGLGTARVADDEIRRTVARALDLGYRLIDTAAKYDNEAGVGRGIADADLPRQELFVTTKLRGADQGYESATQAPSMTVPGAPRPRLRGPVPHPLAAPAAGQVRRDVARAGRAARSRPGAGHRRLQLPPGPPRPAGRRDRHGARRQPDRAAPGAAPARARADNARRGIVTESWSPLAMAGALLDQPVLAEIAAKHARSPAQVVLRWHVQQGLGVVPKSSRPRPVAGEPRRVRLLPRPRGHGRVGPAGDGPTRGRCRTRRLMNRKY